jgi:hypothetical protein
MTSQSSLQLGQGFTHNPPDRSRYGHAVRFRSMARVRRYINPIRKNTAGVSANRAPAASAITCESDKARQMMGQ